MLIADQDWSKVSLSTLAHAAQGGAHGAAAELRKREVTERMTPAQRAAAVQAVKDGGR